VFQNNRIKFKYWLTITYIYVKITIALCELQGINFVDGLEINLNDKEGKCIMIIKNSSARKNFEVLEGVAYRYNPKTEQHENIVTEQTKRFFNEISTLNTHEVYNEPFISFPLQGKCMKKE
jgi:hypothetical protein